MKKKFVYSFIALLIGVTSINISLSVNSDKLNFEGLFSTIEALASGENLPEVDVICSDQGWGRCWEPDRMGPLPTTWFCVFSGLTTHYCVKPI